MSNPLGMSDDDFLKLNAPGPAPASDGDTPRVEDGNETQDENNDPDDTTGAAAQEGEAGNEGTDDDGASGSDDGAGDDDGEGGADDAADDPAGDAAGAGSDDGAAAGDPGSADGKKDAAAGADKADGDKKPADKKDGAESAVTEKEGARPDFEAFYNQVMKPFKANGKEVTPRSIEEVIRLMQMGAGFGRKLQDMQPHIKTLKMLEKENLLDPTELSFLIDIRNKNPEAIKKIIKDANIDPLDLNIEDNVSYKPVDRSVTDAEMNFEDALSSLKERTNGAEFIQHINQSWDKESMGLLWEKPELLGIFQDQRESGVYDKIVAEIEHQKTFGKIAPNTPFIQAYTIAGDALAASGALGQIQTPETEKVAETNPAPQPKVVATRTQPPKPAAANGDKANAAAPSRTSPKKAAQVINPLQMADEDFLKQFEGRL